MIDKTVRVCIFSRCSKNQVEHVVQLSTDIKFNRLELNTEL